MSESFERLVGRVDHALYPIRTLNPGPGLAAASGVARAIMASATLLAQ